MYFQLSNLTPDEFADAVEAGEQAGFCGSTIDPTAIKIPCTADNFENLSAALDAIGMPESDYSIYNKYGLMSRCESSGKLYPEHELRKTPEGELIHIDIWHDEYFECEGCGYNGYSDYAMYHEDDGCTYCEDCYPRAEVQFFDGPQKTFAARNSFGSSRSFGIELETTAGYCSENFAFDGKSDASITGTEYVSHVLRGDKGMQELKEFMQSGNGMEWDETCGIHIHVNASDLTKVELYAVYAAYVVTQDYWHDQVEEHRDGTNYAHRFHSGQFSRIASRLRDGDSFRSCVRDTDRYFWLNAGAFNKHKTFENRLFHASWDYAEVSHWLKLNLRFVRAARSLRIDPTDTYETFAIKARVALEWAANGSLSRPYTQQEELEPCV